MLWAWPAVISGTLSWSRPASGAGEQGWIRSQGSQETCQGMPRLGTSDARGFPPFLTLTARVLGEVAPGPSRMMESLWVFSSQPGYGE